MNFAGINYLAVVIAAVAGFGIGALWYSVLFVKPWMAAMGITEAEIQAKRESGAAPSMGPLLAASLVGNLVMAFILSALLHTLSAATVTIGGGLMTAFLVWLGFVITVMGVNNGFGGRNVMVTAIDGAHWLVVLLVMGMIIGFFG